MYRGFNMAYSIDQDLEIMKEIERISQEPVNESQYTAVRHGVKPIVESMAVFDDVKVDFNKWTSDNKKVNKAKTVDTGSATPVTKNDTVVEKKEDGKVTEVTNVEEKKDDGKVTEVKQESDGDKAKPAPEVKNFDSKANAAAETNRAEADKKKKFAEVAKKQEKFKAFIESLVVDEASRKAADTVLAKADKVFKAQLEATNEELGSSCEDANTDNYIGAIPDEDVIPTLVQEVKQRIDGPVKFKRDDSKRSGSDNYAFAIYLDDTFLCKAGATQYYSKRSNRYEIEVFWGKGFTVVEPQRLGRAAEFIAKYVNARIKEIEEEKHLAEKRRRFREWWDE
jgi:hypothetical protein